MAVITKNRLIEALCDPQNRTLDAAARAAGVSARTARRWRQEPGFQAALDGAQAAVIDELAGRLMATLPQAESTYLQLMQDTSQAPGVRLRAAGGLVELTLRLFELRTLERRIAALEAHAGGLEGLQ